MMQYTLQEQRVQGGFSFPVGNLFTYSSLFLLISVIAEYYREDRVLESVSKRDEFHYADYENQMGYVYASSWSMNGHTRLFTITQKEVQE